ncbi:hypothetical protein Q9L58_003095, partial [Maublancomyces gigas]
MAELNMLEQWYYEVPVVTRVWTTAAVITSVLVQCQIVTPFQLFYSFTSVWSKRQILSPIASMPFLGSPLSFSLVYIWARRNPSVRLSFLGLFVFTAPYLPWVLLGFSLLLHNTLPKDDLLGIVVGHIYYFFSDIYPRIRN